MGSVNQQIFALGIFLIGVGYLCMYQGPVDSFLSRTLSPIILVTAYCVVIPLAILYRKKQATPSQLRPE